MTKIKLEITQYLNQGFNMVQALSLAWADHFNNWMDANAHRGNGSLFGPEVRIDTYCNDCKQGGQFLPCTTRDFIIRHKGHNTKTIKLR